MRRYLFKVLILLVAFAFLSAAAYAAPKVGAMYSKSKQAQADNTSSPESKGQDSKSAKASGSNVMPTSKKTANVKNNQKLHTTPLKKSFADEERKRKELESQKLKSQEKISFQKSDSCQQASETTKSIANVSNPTGTPLDNQLSGSPKVESPASKEISTPNQKKSVSMDNESGKQGSSLSVKEEKREEKPGIKDEEKISETEEKKVAPDEGKPDLLKEKPVIPEEGTVRITAIEVVGNAHIETDAILAVVRSKVGDTLLEPRLRSDVQAIYEMGYFSNIKVDTPYFAGGVKLIFRVTENPVVTKITILGNKIVPTSKILELMQTKEGKILNTSTLGADRAEIDYYYDESLGYQLKPTHTKDVQLTSDGELILTIQEGMVVKAIEVKGSSLYSEEKLLKLITMKPGDLYNTKKVKEDTTAISKFYEEEGYVPDTIRPQVNYKDGIVTIQIIEAVVEDIKVEISPVQGRTKAKTKEEVVLRNIRVKKGEVLQQKKLKRDIERLNNLGFFSRVNVDPEPGSKPGYVVLVFKMTEQKTGLATIGVGYAGGGSGAVRNGITGAISVSEKNLGGTGQGAGLSWQRGPNVDALSASYSNPAINKNQDSISVSIFRNNFYALQQPISNDINNRRFALYDDLRHGGNVIYGRRLTDDFRLFFSYRHEVLEIRKNASSDYEPIGVSKGTLNAGGIGFLYDTRNDVFDATEGSYADFSSIYAGGLFKGSYEYQKYQLEMRKYIPIGRRKKSTIALRAWGGTVQGNINKVPVTETFYVGGTDTIRAYAQNEFFGTRMVVLNAEYRFPLGNIKFLKGAIFADAGNAWFPDDKRKRLYTDAGAGLRIVFPTLGLGVIRVDYAGGERGGRTSIGIGQTF